MPWVPVPLAPRNRSDRFRAVAASARVIGMSESPRRHLRVVNPEPVAVPRVWLLLGERQGDNAQVLALGRALSLDLGWSCEVKQIRYDPNCEVPFRNRGATLIGVEIGRASCRERV